MTMTKLRNKMIPARINREKGKESAVTHTGPRRRITEGCEAFFFYSYSRNLFLYLSHTVTLHNTERNSISIFGRFVYLSL